MPTRIIRDGCLESERINALSLGAEVFYKRLWHVVDDFGRYEYSPMALLSKAFPLRREYTEQQLEQWMRECSTPIRKGVSPLVLLYTVAGKTYLQVTDFKQRIRPGTLSRWPEPSGEFLDFSGVPPLFADFGGVPPRNSATRARSTSHTTAPPTPASPPTGDGAEEPTQPCVAEWIDPSESPAPEPKADEGWLLFRGAASSVGMLATDREWFDLETATWPRLPVAARLAAIRGIDLRREGEYRDPAFVHGAKKYLTEELWTKPPRPVPKSRSPVVVMGRRERAREEFHKRMAQEKGFSKGLMIGDGKG